MTQRKVLSTIPEVPANLDPTMRRMLVAMKEALEVRLGRRGDPLEEAVTKRDLVGAGIAGVKRNGELSPPGGSGTDQTPSNLGVLPPLPVAFQAVGVFGGVLLSWDMPSLLYQGHAQTEIWRSPTPSPADRVYIGTAVGSSFFDTLPTPDEVTYYYWVRFVSETGRKGPFSEVAEATKLPDMLELLTRLSGEIDESVLSTALSERIALIDASDATPGSVAARIKAESIERVQDDQVLAMSVSTLQTVVEGNTASISQQALALDGLSAQYTLRLDVNGRVSGFGAYNDGKTSDFAVLADRFWIAPPNSVGQIKPFIVQNNKVYIDTAMIRDASIQAAQIGSVSFGKVVDGQGRPVTVVGGGLKAQYIQTDELWAALARINYAVIGSAQIKDASISRAKIGDLAVDTLKIAGNAVTVPKFATASWTVPGTSVMAPIVSLTFQVPADSWLYASTSASIGYTREQGQYVGTELTIDGSVVARGGGRFHYNSVAHSGALYFSSARTVTVSLRFLGDSGSLISSASLFAMVVRR